MSHYQLQFTFATQFAMQDHIFKNVLRPLADYLIMFINGEELKKYKEYEAESEGQLAQTDGLTYSESINRSHIDGTFQDGGGNVYLKDGKTVNIMQIMKNLESCKTQVDIGKGTTQGVL